MAGTRQSPRPDRRVERTRTALASAFHRLILDRGDRAIAVSDIIELANVGRSTFYEHYAGVDDLLMQSLQGPFGLLVHGSLASDADPALASVLDHFWENRRVGGALLAGDAHRLAQRQLVACFERALSARWPLGDGDGGAGRRKVVAVQLAAGHLAVIAAWLGGRLSVSAEEIALVLRGATRAATQALFEGAT